MAARRQRPLILAGTRAPDFQMERLEGGEVRSGEILAGGAALLAFFKITCPVCQMTFPFLERISAGTLPIYGVSQNDAEDTREFNREFGVSFPTLLDAEERGFPASNAFGISSVPTMFLLAADGIVEEVIEGWTRKQIEWLGSRAGVNPFRPGDRVPEWKSG